MRAVLLLAHGSPESLSEQDLRAYLVGVRGGRPPSDELVEEMRSHYAAIGGPSPLKEITLGQARALEATLGDGTRVYVGMRHGRPGIAEALQEAAAGGVREGLIVPMAPQYSSMSVGKYEAAVEEARPEGMALRFVRSWHAHPGLLDAFAEKLIAALARDAPDAVVFTAHSIPLRVAREGDPYVAEVTATAEGVASRAGVAASSLAWQSAGRTPEPWLSPSLEETLGDLGARGRRRVLAAPVGFVSDHAEILYDIDVEAVRRAEERGLVLTRTESLNTSPTFIGALADVVRSHRG